MNEFRIVDYSETQQGKEVKVSTESDVRTFFAGVAERGSAYLDVESGDFGTLTIAISGSYGFVQHRDVQRDPEDLCAVNMSASKKKASVEFNIGGTATPIARVLCLRFNDVIDIAVVFVTTGELSNVATWQSLADVL